MKGGLEVIIRKDGITVSYERGMTVEEFQGEDLDAGECLQNFTEKHGISSVSVNLFVAEDLVYATAINLPVKTPDIGEAVKFQLGLATPFQDDDVLYSYTSQRQGELLKVTIFAASSKLVVISVEEIIEAGFQVRGLYPESQRYVTGKAGKEKWALVLPGKFTKVFLFSGTTFDDSMLCNTDLSFAKLSELCETEDLYHVAPPIGSRFHKTHELLSGTPVLKDFNMLPATYRRPDYTKMVIIALLVINVLALVFFSGNKLRALDGVIEKADAEIVEIMPLVKETNKVRNEIRQGKDFLASVKELEPNHDLITFLTNLTSELPENSYLDQLRLDGKQNVIVIQGYTDDVGELTQMLGTLGEARLKSTSRRRNRTYFQVEISLK